MNTGTVRVGQSKLHLSRKFNLFQTHTQSAWFIFYMSFNDYRYGIYKKLSRVISHHREIKEERNQGNWSGKIGEA